MTAAIPATNRPVAGGAGAATATGSATNGLVAAQAQARAIAVLHRVGHEAPAARALLALGVTNVDGPKRIASRFRATICFVDIDLGNNQ